MSSLASSFSCPISATVDAWIRTGYVLIRVLRPVSSLAPFQFPPTSIPRRRDFLRPHLAHPNPLYYIVLYSKLRSGSEHPGYDPLPTDDRPTWRAETAGKAAWLTCAVHAPLARIPDAVSNPAVAISFLRDISGFLPFSFISSRLGMAECLSL